MSRRWQPGRLTREGFLLGALVAALVMAGCGGSDSEEAGGSTDTVAATEAAETTKQPESGPTEADLEPVGDNTASGTARYKIKPNSTPVLQLRLKGLDPVSGNSQYSIWMVGSRHDMVTIATYYVGKSGRLSQDLRNVESFVFVEDGSKTQILITKVNDANRLREAMSESSDPWDPPLIGEPVLRGDFTGAFVGSAGE